MEHSGLDVPNAKIIGFSKKTSFKKVGNNLQWFFDDISFSRMNSNGWYEKKLRLLATNLAYMFH